MLAPPDTAVTRPWLGLGVVYICVIAFAFVFQMVPPLIPVLIRELDLSHSQAGLLMSLFALPGIALSIPGGFLIDRFGVRLIGTAGLVTMAAGALGMGLAQGVVPLLLARTLAGAGGMVAVVALQRSVTRLFEGRPLGLPMGLSNTAVPVGIVIILNVSGPLAESLGWRAVFLGAGALGFLTAILFAVQCTVQGISDAPGVDRDSPAPRLQAIWIAGFVWLCANGAMTVFVTFSPDIYFNRGFDTASRGLFVSLPMWCAAILGPAVGWITDRRGGRRTFIIAGMALMTIFIAATPFQHPGPLLIGICLGLALACVPTPLLSLPGNLLTPAHHGRAFGILSACANIGIFALPPMAGAARDLSGSYLPAFLLAACIALGGAFIGLRLPKTCEDRIDDGDTG